MTATAGLRAAPPGRAGRTWLRRRLATAQRGREQLDRKLRILLPQRRRTTTLRDRRREEWVSACAEATTWLRRAVLLGGEDALRLAQPVQTCRVSVRWEASVGVTYPAEVAVERAPSGPDVVWANAAMAPLDRAAVRAVEAGARLAAAEEALRRLDREIALTRRRLRALDQRWTPRLSEALRELELVLEQGEQEDATRRRSLHSSQGPGRGAP